MAMPERDHPTRVVLHVGRHKTGTTTIQTALARGGAFRYPVPGSNGPGHADLCWSIRGTRGQPGDVDALQDVIAGLDRDAPGTTPIVISSEMFESALNVDALRTALKRLAASHPVELVITLRPDHLRLASVAAQLIVQGQTTDLQNYWEPATKNVTMRPGIVPAFRAMAPWSHVHVILVDPTDEDHLFRSFEFILGCPVERVSPKNTRWPDLALAQMAGLNGLLGRVAPADEMQARRRLALSLGATLADGDRLVRDRTLPAIPETVIERFRAQWEDDLVAIEALSVSEDVILHRSAPEGPRRPERAPSPVTVRSRPAAPTPHAPGPPSALRSLRIHAGLPKTGTSSLQAFLAQNATQLIPLGVHYPRTGAFDAAADGRVAAGNGRDLALWAAAQPGAYGTRQDGLDRVARRRKLNVGPREITEDLRALRSEADTMDCDVVVSSEYFTPLSREAITALADVALSAFKDIQVVLVLRDPAEFLATTYQQAVRGNRREARSLPEFWRLTGRQLLASRLETPLRYADILGDERVTVIPYRTSSTDTNELLVHILSELTRRSATEIAGLIADGSLKPIDSPLNRSLGPIATELLRRANAAGADRRRIGAASRSIERSMPQGRRFGVAVPEEIRAELNALAGPILDEFAERFGVAPNAIIRPAAPPLASDEELPWVLEGVASLIAEDAPRPESTGHAPDRGTGATAKQTEPGRPRALVAPIVRRGKRFAGRVRQRIRWVSRRVRGMRSSADR